MYLGGALQAASCDTPIEVIGIRKQQSVVLTFVHLKLVLTVKSVWLSSPHSRLLCKGAFPTTTTPSPRFPGLLYTRRGICGPCKGLQASAQGTVRRPYVVTTPPNAVSCRGLAFA
jgi:hypothetical protein